MAILVLSAIVLTVLRFLLFEIDKYRPQIQKAFVQQTGIPLEVGLLTANNKSFNPEIVLHQVALKSVADPEQAAVKIAQTRIGLNIFKLITEQSFLAATQFAIEGAQFTLQRDQQGKITVQGFPEDDDGAPEWLLECGQYALLNSDITWIDHYQKQQQSRFGDVDLFLVNDLSERYHEVHLLADLPDSLGRRLRFSINVNGDVFQPDSLSGRFYIHSKDVHLANLLGEIEKFAAIESELQFQSGRGNFDLWGAWSGVELTELAGKLSAENLHLKQQNRQLLLDQISLDFAAIRRQQDWRIRGQNIALAFNQFIWPTAEFSLTVAENQRYFGLLNRLELEMLQPLAAFFQPTLMRRLPQKTHFSGQLNDWAFFWDGLNQDFALQGAFSDLTLPLGGGSRLSGLSGRLHGVTEQGVIELQTNGAKLIAEDLFNQAIAVDKVDGRLNWFRRDSATVLESKNVVLDAAGFNSDFSLSFKLAENWPESMIDFQMKLQSDRDLSLINQVLPLKIMGKQTAAWLNPAFKAGELLNGKVIINGSLEHFPYHQKPGVFEASFDVQNGILQYHPDWPYLYELNAHTRFWGKSMQVDIRRARSEKVKIKQAVVKIPDMEFSKHLLVDGLLQTDIADALSFMQKTPQADKVAGLIESAKVRGLSRVDLKMQLPLVDDAESHVDGTVHLNKARLSLNAVDVQADRLKGKVQFTENGVYSQGILGQMFDNPVQTKINTDRQATWIDFSGKAEISRLTKSFPYLKNKFSEGVASFNSVLKIPADAKPAKLTIASDLKGMALDLPDNLSKQADKQEPLQVEITLAEDNLLPVIVEYAEKLKLNLLADKRKLALYGGDIVYGGGVARSFQKAGFQLRVKRRDLDLDAWLSLFDDNKVKDKATVLESIDIDVRQVHWKNAARGALSLQAQRSDNAFSGRIVHEIARGNFEIPFDLQNKKVVLDMETLDLSRLSALQQVFQAEQPIRQQPLIKLNSKHVWWRRMDLGRLEMNAERLTNGMRFKQSRLLREQDQISFDLDWLNDDAGSRTLLSGHLESQDLGAFLQELGYDSDLLETDALLAFSGAWPGSPGAISAKALSGVLNVDLRNGRVASIEPGFGRLLGLVAMQQWIKRFSLDFSDIYQKGLAFNSITGQFNIEDGKATTENLLIDAISARIKISGQSDLLHNTLNHHIWVVPKSSDAVPIAGTIVGQIASAVTKVITDDYKEGFFFGSEYQVTGSWNKPELVALQENTGLINKVWKDLTDFPWIR